MDEIIIEEKEKKEEILLEEKILIPKLDNLIIIPTAEEQNFKNKNYGYGDITVKAIEGEEVAIIPNANEQTKEGIFNKVTVAGDSNLIPENIKEGTEIFGVQGNYKGEVSEYNTILNNIGGKINDSLQKKKRLR